MSKPKKKANPRIRSKKRSNVPRMSRVRVKPPKPEIVWPEDIDFTKYGEEREKMIQGIADELAEARWQRQYAYSIRHAPVYLQGRLYDPGLKHGSEHDLRRTMCDMWVTSLHRLHELILGLPPAPDATELEYPLKIPKNPPSRVRIRT